jgi:hypothetical protein
MAGGVLFKKLSLSTFYMARNALRRRYQIPQYLTVTTEIISKP